MPNLKGWEWLIIVALILLLFGAKRLPDAARGLGRSLRIFKAETKGLAEKPGDTPAAAAEAPSAGSLPPAPTPQPEDPAQDPVPTERREA
jgi:sec-independent protein translocase protein TatA